MRTSAPNPSASERDEEALRRAQRAHEPSMEEILASIRTIIAEERLPASAPEQARAPENKGPERGAPVAALAAAPAPAPTIRAKTDPARPAAAARTELEPDSSPHAAAPRPGRNDPVPAAAAQPAAVETPATDDALLSAEAGQAVASSFDALSARLAQRATEVAEAVARDMLRPMLKAWLDENLPAIVERLVRAEIERLSKASL